MSLPARIIDSHMVVVSSNEHAGDHTLPQALNNLRKRGRLLPNNNENRIPVALSPTSSATFGLLV